MCREAGKKKMHKMHVGEARAGGEPRQERLNVSPLAAAHKSL